MNVQFVVHLDNVKNSDLKDSSRLSDFEYDVRESLSNLLQNHMGVECDRILVGFTYNDEKPDPVPKENIPKTKIKVSTKTSVKAKSKNA